MLITGKSVPCPFFRGGTCKEGECPRYPFAKKIDNLCPYEEVRRELPSIVGLGRPELVRNCHENTKTDVEAF